MTVQRNEDTYWPAINTYTVVQKAVSVDTKHFVVKNTKHFVVNLNSKQRQLQRTCTLTVGSCEHSSNRSLFILIIDDE